LRFSDGQRRREADDVAMLAFRQQDEAALEHGLDRRQHPRGGRRTITAQQLNSDHQTKAPNGHLHWRLAIGNLRLKFSQQQAAQSATAIDKPPLSDLANLRQGHRTADGMAQEGARVDGLTQGRRPRGIHHLRPPDAGRERKATGQRLAGLAVRLQTRLR